MYAFVHLGDSLAYQVSITNTDIYKCSFPPETVCKCTVCEVCRCFIDDGYKLFNCDVLIHILCLDCSFLNVRVNFFFSHHHIRVCI